MASDEFYCRRGYWPIPKPMKNKPTSAHPSGSAKVPMKELSEIMARVKADAEANVLHFRTDAYEHGAITRLKKWRKRLRDINKVIAWMESQNTEQGGSSASVTG